jgi:hypothetical protein
MSETDSRQTDTIDTVDTSEPADPPLEWLETPIDGDDSGAGGTRLHARVRKNSPPTGSNSIQADHPDASETAVDSRAIFADLVEHYRVRPHERHRSHLAPADYDATKLPDPFRDGDGAATLAECRRAYRRIVATNHDDPTKTSKIDQADQRYRKLLEADRLLQKEYSLTTVLVTLRPHPIDEFGRVVTPLGLDRAVFAAKAEYPFRRKLAYQLSKLGVAHEYATVVAGTERWATPHLHAAVYVDDPEDAVGEALLRPVMEQLMEDCPLAYPRHHTPDSGAVRIEHEPPVADTDARTDVDVYADRPATRIATYLGAQLPHFALKSELEGRGRADPWEIDGAVTAWASPSNWFQTTRGISQISNIQTEQ